MPSLVQRLKELYLCHFSRPAHHRALYRQILRGGVARILEIGVGTGERAQRMLQAARYRSATQRMTYSGIDLFETRQISDGEGMTLKEAYCRLRGPDVKLRLVPGDVYSALVQSANALGTHDLIVISANGVDSEALGRAWFYVPRLMHASTMVLIEKQGTRPGTMSFERMTLAEIQRLATSGPRRRAA